MGDDNAFFFCVLLLVSEFILTIHRKEKPVESS